MLVEAKRDFDDDFDDDARPSQQHQQQQQQNVLLFAGSSSLFFSFLDGSPARSKTRNTTNTTYAERWMARGQSALRL